ncbi:hypothetical protein LCGC14_1509440 [marine sediment metagenome]|uniref:LamG-like jellyroll fold domain-containing protein n=1 Tax=marine sediment metagenome TaxID=412755 RepID=A0A0F9JMJ9_9ZZZZ
MNRAPFGRAVVNKRSLQYRGLRSLISPYLAPGLIGTGLLDPAANQIMDIHNLGVSYVYEPGFGTVWEFDGADGNVESTVLGAGMGTCPKGPISYCWWCTKSSAGEAGLGRILQQDGEVIIYANGNNLDHTDYRWTGIDGGWSRTGAFPNSSIPKHFCITYDAVIAGAGPQLYINGLFDGAMTETTAPTGTPTDIGGGQRRNVGNAFDSSSRTWDGRIWDVRIYAGVLQPAQVWRIFDQKTRFALYELFTRFFLSEMLSVLYISPFVASRRP